MGRDMNFPQTAKIMIDFFQGLCYNTPCVQRRSPLNHIGMSPSGKASDFDSDIRRFESGHPSQFDPLAQSVEQLPFKQWVRGSSPRRVTNQSSCAKSAGGFFVEIVLPHQKKAHVPKDMGCFGAGYGSRTRLHGLGSRCITDIRILRTVRIIAEGDGKFKAFLSRGLK